MEPPGQKALLPASALTLNVGTDTPSLWVDCSNVALVLVGVWAGTVYLQSPKPLFTTIEQLKPLSSTTVPDMFTPLLELDSLSVTVPTQSTLAEKAPPRAVHVPVASLVKVRLPVADLPSAAVLPLRVASGHLTATEPARELSVEVPVTAVLTGVTVACAGTAATANVVSIATSSSRPRLEMCFM